MPIADFLDDVGYPFGLDVWYVYATTLDGYTMPLFGSRNAPILDIGFLG
jgi:hypothetical protein